MMKSNQTNQKKKKEQRQSDTPGPPSTIPHVVMVWTLTPEGLGAAGLAP
jgi:hypothetical protein